LTGLEKYIGHYRIEFVSSLIKDYSLLLKISKDRSSKLGDYILLNEKWKHKITINFNLNPEQFFITLLHEIAHMYTREKFGYRVEPHGKEWKNEYSIILKKALNEKMFPSELESAIVTHLNNPKAASCTDLDLYNSLKKYDIAGIHFSLTDLDLSALPLNSYFELNNSIYLKGEILRKTYKCIDIVNLQQYRINQAAFVTPISDKTKYPQILRFEGIKEKLKPISQLREGQEFTYQKKHFYKASDYPLTIKLVHNKMTYKVTSDILVLTF